MQVAAHGPRFKRVVLPIERKAHGRFTPAKSAALLAIVPHYSTTRKLSYHTTAPHHTKAWLRELIQPPAVELENDDEGEDWQIDEGQAQVPEPLCTVHYSPAIPPAALPPAS
jgi:hypothetical protein